MIDPGNESGGVDSSVDYSTVNFEPYLQTTPIVSGTWQTWNVMDGVVWGTHLTGAPNAAPISWSAFIAEYPNATILPVGSGGGVGFNVGSNWSSVTGNVGDFTVGTSAGHDGLHIRSIRAHHDDNHNADQRDVRVGWQQFGHCDRHRQPCGRQSHRHRVLLRVWADHDAHAVHLHRTYRR